MIFHLLTAVLVVLKLLGLIKAGWLLVLAPTLIIWGVTGFILVCLFMLGVLAAAFGK